METDREKTILDEGKDSGKRHKVINWRRRLDQLLLLSDKSNRKPY